MASRKSRQLPIRNEPSPPLIIGLITGLIYTAHPVFFSGDVILLIFISVIYILSSVIGYKFKGIFVFLFGVFIGQIVGMHVWVNFTPSIPGSGPSFIGVVYILQFFLLLPAILFGFMGKEYRKRVEGSKDKHPSVVKT